MGPEGEGRGRHRAVDEGHVSAGRFVVGHRLNGDETHQGRQLRLPMGALGVQRVKVYTFK